VVPSMGAGGEQRRQVELRGAGGIYNVWVRGR
jgi:hypothetical protein